MPFEATIRAFAAALGDPSATPPSTTRGRTGTPDARRFAVYRNNVAVGLIGAIEARYPVSRRLAGEDLFRAMARAYVHARKPRSPVMIAYGDDFPEFLAACDGVDACLADVARLENAWVEAYHAEDARAATVGELAALKPDRLPGTRIVLHPAARLLRFQTPAASLWAAAQSEGARPGSRREAARTLWSRGPTATSQCARFPRLAMISRSDCATARRSSRRLRRSTTRPSILGAHLVGLVEAGAVAAIIPGQGS